MTPIDTPSRLRRARRKMGLDKTELASKLRLAKGGRRSVERWETEGAMVPGPVQVAVESLLREFEAIGRMKR